MNKDAFFIDLALIGEQIALMFAFQNSVNPNRDFIKEFVRSSVMRFLFYCGKRKKIRYRVLGPCEGNLPVQSDTRTAAYGKGRQGRQLTSLMSDCK